MRHIIAMYRDVKHAEGAIGELIAHGVPRDRISIVSNDASRRYRDLSSDRKEEAAKDGAKGATAGALGGTVAGVLASLGLAAIPGIGWILAAGPIGSMIASGAIGAAAGAAAGGLGEGLSKTGVPERRAHTYAEGVRRGGTMIMAEVDDHLVDEATRVLDRHDPIDIDRHAKRWETEGWKRYEAKSDPYTFEQSTSEWNSFGTDTNRSVSRVHRYTLDNPNATERRWREERLGTDSRSLNREDEPTGTR